MTSYRLFNIITLASMASRKRNRLIAWLLFIGPLLLAIALIQYTFYIGRIDSKILEVDKQITAAQDNMLKFALAQSMFLVPNDLITLLGLVPNALSWIKDDLGYETKKMQQVSLGLLCWPWAPTMQQDSAWKAMTFDQLENQKGQLVKSFAYTIQQLIDVRLESIKKKQSRLLWATLFQVFGLVLTGIGTSLRALSR